MNHREAFHLMHYRCDQCGRTEVLWNSRDGVTSFIINCTACDGSMSHVDWNQDVPDENFRSQLEAGMFPSMRIFIDAASAPRTMRAKARKYVEEWWDKKPALGGGTMREVLTNTHGAWMTKSQAVDFFVKEWSKDGGPAIVTAKDWIRGDL